MAPVGGGPGPARDALDGLHGHAALERPEDIDRAVHWVLGRPGIFLNTAGDLTLLPRVLDAASRFAGRPSEEAMRAMQDATRMSSLFGLPT